MDAVRRTIVAGAIALAAVSFTSEVRSQERVYVSEEEAIGKALAGAEEVRRRTYGLTPAESEELSRELGLAILDTMRFIKPDISTFCVVQAASMAAVLLSAGTKGKRFALPNSRIIIHQPLGGVQGQASDIDIQAREILRLRKALNQILVETTGQGPEKLKTDTDRDYIMDAEQSREYGIIDEVISERS